jgi:hypothetical protein
VVAQGKKNGGTEAAQGKKGSGEDCYDTLRNPSPTNGPKQFDSSIHPLTHVSIKTDAFRRDLRIRDLRSTIGATVQKVKFWSTPKSLSNIFLVLQ